MQTPSEKAAELVEKHDRPSAYAIAGIFERKATKPEIKTYWQQVKTELEKMK